MFKKIYRAMVVARVGSAAAHVVCNMTDRQLADAGIDRRTFPMDAMKRMEAEFAAVIVPPAPMPNPAALIEAKLAEMLSAAVV